MVTVCTHSVLRGSEHWKRKKGWGQSQLHQQEPRIRPREPSIKSSSDPEDPAWEDWETHAQVGNHEETSACAVLSFWDFDRGNCQCSWKHWRPCGTSELNGRREEASGLPLSLLFLSAWSWWSPTYGHVTIGSRTLVPAKTLRPFTDWAA